MGDDAEARAVAGRLMARFRDLLMSLPVDGERQSCMSTRTDLVQAERMGLCERRQASNARFFRLTPLGVRVRAVLMERGDG